MGYCFLCCCCTLRIPGMRSDHVCFIVALDANMLRHVVRSPLAAVHQPHTYTVNGTKARAWSNPSRCRCTAAAAVLLYTYCADFVAARLSGCLFCVPMAYHDSRHSADTYLYRSAHTTHTEAPSVAVTKECCCCCCCCVVADGREGEQTGPMMLYSRREGGAG